MKYLWQEMYRECRCTMTEVKRDSLPGFCPDHDHPRQTRSKIPEPEGFKRSDLGLKRAQAPVTVELCEHNANKLRCPYCALEAPDEVRKP